MPPLFKKSSSKRFRPNVPVDQRKRIARACRSCRLGKRRCVLVSPDQCRNCKNKGSTCIFETEENVLIAQTSGRLDSIQDVAAQFNSHYPEVGLEAHHCALLMRILMDSDAIPTPVPAFPRAVSPGACDLLAHKDFLDYATGAVSQSERPDLFGSSTSFYPSNGLQSEYDDALVEHILSDFPSKKEAEVLVSTFFTYAEANWYYFDETSFRSQLSGLYDRNLTTSVTDTDFICLTLTVFALGSQFVHIYQASRLRDPEVIAAEDAGTPGARFFRHAQNLIPRVITSPSLEGLLSCLLISLYVLPIYNTNVCYTYLGLALRTCVCLGLHGRSVDLTLPPTASEVRNRIFWTTYSIERRVAIALGYPEMLSIRDINCPLPQRRPELDPPDSFRPERLLAYTKLTLLLNRAVHSRSRYHNNNLDKHVTEEIRNELLAWKRDLPEQLTKLDSPAVRPNVHLQLHYSMIWTYISRAVLIRSVRDFLGNRRQYETDPEPSPKVKELSKCCVQHAEQIVDLIDLLRNRRQLCRFSHTDLYACCSATIIILLESILHPRLNSYSKVSSAMDALGFLASGSDFAKASLKHVNNFQAVVNKALASMSHQARTPSIDKKEARLTMSTDLPSRAEPSQLSGGAMDAPQELSFPPFCTLWKSEHHPSIATANLSSYDPGDHGPDGTLFGDIGALPWDCPFADMHLLGFGGYYTPEELEDNSGFYS